MEPGKTRVFPGFCLYIRKNVLYFWEKCDKIKIHMCHFLSLRVCVERHGCRYGTKYGIQTAVDSGI